MSIQAVAWAIKTRVGDPALKCLLIAIANYADEDGTAFPSLDRLAFDTEISKRTVQRKMKELQTLGLLEITHRTRTNGTRCSSLLRLIRSPAEASGQIVTMDSPVDKTPPQPVAKTAKPVDTKVATPDPSLENHQVTTTSGTRARDEAVLKVEAELIFDNEIWPVAPERDGGNPKKPAKERFVRHVIRGENPQEIVAGVARLRAYHEAKGDIGTDKVPQLVTWMNQKRWENQQAAPPRNSAARKLDFFDIAAGKR